MQIDAGVNAHAALTDWQVQACVVIGLLLLCAAILLCVSTTIRASFRAWNVFLTMAIASTWVGTAQFAQGASARSSNSLLQLIIWVNGTVWLFLGLPHIIQRLWHRDWVAVEHLTTSDLFTPRHTILFFLIAFATNSAYIEALRFLFASLNSAIFSTTSIFTFVLSLAVLKDHPASTTSCGLRSICICFSVLGVVLISGFSSRNTNKEHATSFFEQLAGVALSIAAALGTAVYQVAFKYVFGNRMPPAVVGLFLAHLGAVMCLCYGSLIFGGIALGLVDVDLTNVPWTLVLLTALSSMAFNFLIKFGLSSTSPVTVSLATQLGIPLNLGVDMLVVGAKISRIQVIGVLIMAVSFSLHNYLDERKLESESTKHVEDTGS